MIATRVLRCSNRDARLSLAWVLRRPLRVVGIHAHGRCRFGRRQGIGGRCRRHRSRDPIQHVGSQDQQKRAEHRTCRCCGQVLGIQPRNASGKARFSNAVHWGYGTVRSIRRFIESGTENGATPK